jgi:hypothetical protein
MTLADNLSDRVNNHNSQIHPSLESGACYLILLFHPFVEDTSINISEGFLGRIKPMIGSVEKTNFN